MNTTSPRFEMLTQLADLICAVDRPHPVRVAIDGVDAAGKTTLADELAPLIKGIGFPVIRASVDGFHNSREVRYQKGENSPEGYYRDSFDRAAILRDVLIPLGPGGNRLYRRGVFDFRADAPTPEPACEAPANAILLFDGVFLLRPELIQYWDFSIFVDVDFEISVPRAVARDVARSDGQLTPQTASAKYNQRYVPGQKIYLAEAQPQENADVVFNNNDLANPKWITP